MTGALIAGGLGFAFAALAEVLIWVGIERELGPGKQSLRLIAAAFVAGQAVLGIVIILLALSGPGTVDPLVGLVSSALIGAGTFGIALTYRRYANAPNEPTPADRAAAILRMAASQGAGTIGVVLAMLTLFLSPA
jgi:hypothetical protein